MSSTHILVYVTSPKCWLPNRAGELGEDWKAGQGLEGYVVDVQNRSWLLMRAERWEEPDVQGQQGQVLERWVAAASVSLPAVSER